MNRLPRGFYALSLTGLLACAGLALSAELPAQDSSTFSQSPASVQPTAPAAKPLTAEQAKALDDLTRDPTNVDVILTADRAGVLDDFVVKTRKPGESSIPLRALYKSAERADVQSLILSKLSLADADTNWRTPFFAVLLLEADKIAEPQRVKTTLLAQIKKPEQWSSYASVAARALKKLGEPEPAIVRLYLSREDIAQRYSECVVLTGTDEVWQNAGLRPPHVVKREAEAGNEPYMFGLLSSDQPGFVKNFAVHNYKGQLTNRLYGINRSGKEWSASLVGIPEFDPDWAGFSPEFDVVKAVARDRELRRSSFLLMAYFPNDPAVIDRAFEELMASADARRDSSRLSNYAYLLREAGYRKVGFSPSQRARIEKTTLALLRDEKFKDDSSVVHDWANALFALSRIQVSQDSAPVILQVFNADHQFSDRTKLMMLRVASKLPEKEKARYAPYAISLIDTAKPMLGISAMAGSRYNYYIDEYLSGVDEALWLLLELDDQTLAPYAEQLIAAEDLTRQRGTVFGSQTGPLGKAMAEIRQARQALVDKAVARGEKLRAQSR